MLASSIALLRRRSAAALLAAFTLGACATGGGVQTSPYTASLVSAPVSEMRYELVFDSATAARSTVQVTTRFTTASTAPVLLSLPAWTPGAYELSHFARWVTGFRAEGGGRVLDWDKVDPDTWRIIPAAPGEITVRFDYRADTLDNAMAWSRPDFVFFNGTNLFLYPEGRGFDWPATVTIRTQPGWQVATGMTRVGPDRWGERSYHDLVDMPTFVGRFDLDSMTVAGRTMQLASYPQGAIAGPLRAQFWEHHQQMWPPMLAVFGDTAVRSYTNLIVVTEQIGGGSALEHQNSHLGIYHPGLLPSVSFPSITAHEIFHLWNVKRLRPAALWPYDYARAQPTPLLWVSEGITDYYADLALVRGGIVDSSGFFALTQLKMQQVAEALPVALEDASLSTWIHPIGDPYIYYPKGSLAGLALDILIRDASDGRGSLDAVMRELYQTAYLDGEGFTTEMFWDAASRAAGGRDFGEFHALHVDGREPFPWRTLLPLAAMRLRVDTLRQPLLGVATQPDSLGTLVVQVAPGSVAERAGVQAGDYLQRVGELPVDADVDFGPAFRSRYATREGEPLPIVVRRGAVVDTLAARVELSAQVQYALTADRTAPEKARRILQGILTGRD